MCKTGDEKWAVRQMLDGREVVCVETDMHYRFGAIDKSCWLQWRKPRSKGWAATCSVRRGQYRLAEPETTPPCGLRPVLRSSSATEGGSPGAPEKPKETAMCKSGDARWAWAQIAQFGVVVRRPCDGVVFRAAENCGALYIEFRYPPSTAWTRCSTLSSDTYELVRPEPETTPPCGLRSPGAPEGYERWDRDVNISESQGQRPDITFREQCAQGFNLHRLSHIHGHPGFGYFVFENVDDSGVLQRRYSKHLHIVWDKTAGRFTDGDIGDNGYAFRSLDEVEEVRPVAVLMRNG